MVRPERLLAADAARPPLRCGPPPRNAATSNLAEDGQVVELGLFYVGSSNYNAARPGPIDGPQKI
jgi:hypothetical protein